MSASDEDNASSNDVTLVVTNLPFDTNIDSVQNAFNKYGQIKLTMLFNGDNYTKEAYILYSNYTEAEKAMNDLEGKLPWKFHTLD